VTGLRRKLRAPAGLLGGGLLGALVAVAFGCGAFRYFFYDASAPEYRDIVLVAIAQVTAILGFLLGGSLAAIPRAGVVYGFIGLVATLCVAGLLCAGANCNLEESLSLMGAGACGLLPAAAAGLLARKIVDRSVARAEPSPGTAANPQGS